MKKLFIPLFVTQTIFTTALYVYYIRVDIKREMLFKQQLLQFKPNMK